MNTLTWMSLFLSVMMYFASSSIFAETFKPSSVESSVWTSGTSVTMSGWRLMANCTMACVGAISKFNLVVTVPRRSLMSRSWMWRLSSRRWAVIPLQPASSAIMAAATGSGSLPLRASRMVAMWSTLTPSLVDIDSPIWNLITLKVLRG